MRRLLAAALTLAAVLLTTPAHAETLGAGQVAPPKVWPVPAVVLDQGTDPLCGLYAIEQALRMEGARLTQAQATAYAREANRYVITPTFTSDDAMAAVLARHGIHTTHTDLGHGPAAVDAAIAALGRGPVAISVPFSTGMYDTDTTGHWGTGGTFLQMGHGIVLRGYNPATKRVLLVNSWGSWWGSRGAMWLTLAELRSLATDHPAYVDAAVWQIAR